MACVHRDVCALVYDRPMLPAAAGMSGPAVVAQFDSTALLLPGQVACVDKWRNLIVREGDG